MTDAPLRYLLMATHVSAQGSGGGMIRYTVETARALSRRADVELHVLVTPEAVAFFEGFLPSTQVHTVWGGPTALRSIVERYAPMVSRLPGAPFDVVQGTKHLLPRQVGPALKVLTVHDMLPLDRPGDFGPLKRVLLRFPYLASVRDADLLACMSRASRARLLDYVPEVAARTSIAGPALSNQLLGAAEIPVPALEGRPFALVVGDASARKNLALAVDTWPEVRRRSPGAVLAMAGPASWSGSHRGAQWDELVATGAAVALGHIDDGALAWCYRNARAVLCPSLLEGFGLPSVEGTAFGTTVVTSDDPALCEASGTAAVHVPSWSPEAWVEAVTAALSAPEVPQADRPEPLRRTWDDLAAELVTSVGQLRRSEFPAPDAGGPRERLGVSPYAAPLVVRHVVGSDSPWTRGVVEDLADEHRKQGWSVEVIGTGSAARGEGARGESGPDVLVLHGLVAGKVGRAAPAGSRPTTVVVAGRRRPRGPLGWIRENRLAPHTNAVVVDRAETRRWARLVPVPLTSLAGGFGVRARPDAEEVAAIIARAHAWGS